MSRMLDNLARVLDNEEASVETKRPPLFLVQGEIPPSNVESAKGRPSVDRRALVWAGCAALLTTLGLLALESGTLGPWLTTAHDSGPKGPQAELLQAQTECVQFLKKGQFAQAHKALVKLKERFPKARAVRINLAYTLTALGKLPEAESEYMSLLHTAPQDAIALNNLGALYVKTGRLEDAKTILRKALEALPGQEQASLNLAAIYERERDWEKAAHTYEGYLGGLPSEEMELTLKERLRRLRSLASAQKSPREKF